MSRLPESTINALYRHQSGQYWVGSVHMVSKFHDYVPFLLGGERHLLELLYPQCLNGIGLYADSFLPAGDGGVFIPKRDHRYIELRTVGANGELERMTNVMGVQVENLASTLYQAILAYYQQNPHVSQYFYRAEPALANFVRTELPKLPLPETLTLSFHDEIAEPVYGFSIYPKLTA